MFLVNGRICNHPHSQSSIEQPATVVFFCYETLQQKIEDNLKH